MRALLIVLVVVSAGACGGLAWVLAKPTPPDPRMAPLVAENAQLKQEAVRLREQVGKLESAVAKADERAAKTPAGDVKGTAAPNQLSIIKPAAPDLSAGAKSLMDYHRVEQVDLVYSKLMTRLGLSEEEKAHFRQLLIDRERAQSEASSRVAKAPPENRPRLHQEMLDQRKAFDDTFKAFLNNKDDYEVFKRWEETKTERSMFERNAKPLFASSSEPLTEAQEDQLIELMARRRKAQADVSLMPSVSKLEPAAAEAKIAEWRQSTAQMHAQFQQEAAAALTQGQLEIFAAYLGQRLDSFERTARGLIRTR
jgi:hypothetical protein